MIVFWYGVMILKLDVLHVLFVCCRRREMDGQLFCEEHTPKDKGKSVNGEVSNGRWSFWWHRANKFIFFEWASKMNQWVNSSFWQVMSWGRDGMGMFVHYSKTKKLKEHFDIMIFIERYPLKRCQGCVKLIASKDNCFITITDLSEVQLCMSSNSWTWECPHTKDGADHVP